MAPATRFRISLRLLHRPRLLFRRPDTAAPVIAEPKLDARDRPESIEIETESALVANSELTPAEPAAPPPKVKAAPATAPRTKLEKVELPEPDLDLSLPEDWTESLGPADEPTSLSLLPPLFESSQDSRSLQMSGELLPGMAQDEAIIDGAQINFELKR